MLKKYKIVALVLCVSLLVLSGCKGKAQGMGKPISFTGYPMDADDWTVSWFIEAGTLSQVFGGFGVVPVAAVITTAVPDEKPELIMSTKQ